MALFEESIVLVCKSSGDYSLSFLPEDHNYYTRLLGFLMGPLVHDLHQINY